MTTTNPITISDSAREAEMKATNAAFPVGHFTQLAINSSIEKLNNTINDLLDNGRTLLEQNEKLTAENAALRQALSDASKLIKSACDENERLRLRTEQQLSAAVWERKNIKADNERLRNLIGEHLSNIADLTTQNQQLRASLATSIEEAFREGADLGKHTIVMGDRETIDHLWLTSNARKRLEK